MSLGNKISIKNILKKKISMAEKGGKKMKTCTFKSMKCFFWTNIMEMSWSV